MPDHETDAFVSGVQNLLDDELIPEDAASDEKNWLTQDGRLKLIAGRLRIGTEGPVGTIQGEIFGYKADGTKIHWRKTSAGKIQYLNGSTWTDVVTGLSTTADYTFSNYSSLAGTFTYAFGVDGIFKFHNAVPGSYLALYDSTKNFKGSAFIDKGRTILWNRPEDKTGLYGSYIDRQDSTVYTTVTAETLASGNGTTQTFSGTLGTHGGGASSFGVSPFGQIAATKTITAITQATLAFVTATGHGLAQGDLIYITGVVGMTQINGLIASVNSISDADHFFLNIDASGFTAYSSGGSLYKVEQFTDDYLGNLKSNLGGTGTINYITGAYSLTFNTAPTNASNNILANYQWEASNNKGVTDFSHSATRAAGEGFQFPQDEGGDAIQKVVIAPDGSYMSMKSQSAYNLILAEDDTASATSNLVYRRNMGVPSNRAAVSTSKGIMFINTANPERPEMTILQRNQLGDAIEPAILFPGFRFANYVYDDCHMDTFERYILVFCKTPGASANDTVLLCDPEAKTVDITSFNGRTSATDATYLYIGSSITQSVYQLYSGFDDDGLPIDNYWISKGERLIPKVRSIKILMLAQGLKKVRHLQFKGHISPDQSFEVYVSYDEAGFQLVGTIRGDGTYVDYSQQQVVGANFVGGSQVGGDVVTNVYPFFAQLKIKSPKFRKRAIKIVAKGIGYVEIESMADRNIMTFEVKLPKRFRQKQNVSLDGAQTDLPTPSY
jgi:hypothetical protein